jgi:hypothetical protein
MKVMLVEHRNLHQTQAAVVVVLGQLAVMHKQVQAVRVTAVQVHQPQ